MNQPAITLQINLAPVDYPMVCHTLPHQLSVFAHHCNEVLLTLDTRRVKGSRLSEELWNKHLALLEEFIEKEIKPSFSQTNFTVDKMIYTDAMRKEIGRYFLGKNHTIPLKDFRGGPFYSYYFGLYRAQHDFILHLDADMMIVGDATTWFKEAVEAMQSDATIFACAPLLGPPTDTGDISEIKMSHPKRYNPIKPWKQPYSFLYNDFSTRIFFFNRNKLKGLSRIELPNVDHFVKALWKGNPPYRFPEGTISSLLKRKQWWVLSFKGKNTGLWALHPARGEEFKQKLPLILEAIQQGHYPDSQKGHPDVQPAFVAHVKIPDSSPS